MTKGKITVKGKQIEKFMNWMIENYIWFGDPWMEWWNEIGSQEFAEWVAKRGLKYMKIK